MKDFAIDELLERLRTHSSKGFEPLAEHELESLTATLIYTLTTNLDGHLLTSYINATRYKETEACNTFSSLTLPPPNISLPTCFPDVETPQFLYGDRLCWISDGTPTDWGTVIGRFYGYAPHQSRWAWCYLIWLDPDSPSSNWIKADVAWEEDLEPMQGEEVR